MTLLAEPEAEQTMEAGTAQAAGPAPLVLPVRKLVALALVVVVALLAAAWVFEDPVAHLWYEARQQRLALDYRAQRATIKPGQAVAILQIPAIKLNLTIGEGDSGAELRAGPGHRRGTPLPGQVGNSLVFGHRKGWGAPFANLGKLHTGDPIYVEDRAKSSYEYLVTGVSKVAGGDARPLAKSTDYRLTLVTGSGGRLGAGLLVVTAVSGPVGKLLRPAPHLRTMAPRGSLLFNRSVASLLLRVLAAAGLIMLLRRRHRPAMVAIVVVPVVLAALLALFVDLDLVLSPVG